jgi:peroxiredoxin
LHGPVVIAVDNGEDPKVVAKAVGDRGYTFPVLLDRKGDVHRLYGVLFRPTTVLISSDGTVLAVQVGAHTSDSMRAAIRQFHLQ